MKKILVLILLFLARPLVALYIGNPATPALIYEGILISDIFPISFRVGFEGDFLFDKKFTFPNTGFKNSHVEGNFYLGQATVNFFDRLDLGVSAGGAKMKFSSNFESLDVDERTDMGYIVKAHGKLIVFQVKCVTLAFDGRYLFAKAKDDVFFNNHSTAWFRLRQWQASLSLATNIGFFSPYFGGVYDSSRFKISQSDSFCINGEEKENLGIFVGLTLCANSYFLISFEGQFYSETSFGINAQMRF